MPLDSSNPTVPCMNFTVKTWLSLNRQIFLKNNFLKAKTIIENYILDGRLSSWFFKDSMSLLVWVKKWGTVFLCCCCFALFCFLVFIVFLLLFDFYLENKNQVSIAQIVCKNVFGILNISQLDERMEVFNASLIIVFN